MISGAGMLDFESCQSLEKLVIDAEIIGMAKRLSAGLQPRDKTIALDLIRKHGHNADYLSDPHTLKWFKQEQYIPSAVIDRKAYDTWRMEDGNSVVGRAKSRVDKLLADYKPSNLDPKIKQELKKITETAAARFGMDNLPEIPEV
jgi:trimethylamine--corrinoid protein Co-methyltransferase